jgi:hypothetical protein
MNGNAPSVFARKISLSVEHEELDKIESDQE